MDVCFLDVQGLRGAGGEFVWKEVGILKFPFDNAFDCLVKSPYGLRFLSEKYRRVNYWLRTNKHGLDWNDGWLPYEKLEDLLYLVLMNQQVYVKGTEKMEWVKTLVGKKGEGKMTVCNIEELECPKLSSVKNSSESLKCKKHGKGEKTCAVENVWKMYSFYCNKYKK